jgi:glucuronate isomerase
LKSFMDNNFLLSNETAIKLYHDHAKHMPIIDYHCHLSPQEIYENKSYANITEVWLYGDHYKWRAMRANGIEEQYITGNASDYDRFLAYARTVPQLIGNPLYHWSHLELRRFFGVEEILNESNAPVIWEKVNAKLNSDGFRARELIIKSNVKVIGTTDDPVDSLEYHIKIKEDASFNVAVLPSFRPDKALEINRESFLPWLKKLEQAVGSTVADYDQLLAALESRVRFFHFVGCRISDHALDYVPFAEASQSEVSAIFAKALKGNSVTLQEEQQYKTAILVFLGKQYAERDWAMQYHMNASRNNNARMFKQIGPDTGYDSINDSSVANSLRNLLSAIAEEGVPPKTILYSLNPQDYPLLATIGGCFQDGGIAGQIQLGSAWWFNDTKEGMIHQMKVLADIGLLGRFVGMLTDSRSFLSYPRHEYFRRILCNLIGEWVENGELPNDMELLGSTVKNISYTNAEQYFNF